MFVTFQQLFSDVGEGETTRRNVDELRAYGARWIRLSGFGTCLAYYYFNRLTSDRPGLRGRRAAKGSPRR